MHQPLRQEGNGGAATAETSSSIGGPTDDVSSNHSSQPAGDAPSSSMLRALSDESVSGSGVVSGTIGPQPQSSPQQSQSQSHSSATLAARFSSFFSDLRKKGTAATASHSGSKGVQQSLANVAPSPQSATTHNEQAMKQRGAASSASSSAGFSFSNFFKTRSETKSSLANASGADLVVASSQIRDARTAARAHSASQRERRALLLSVQCSAGVSLLTLVVKAAAAATTAAPSSRPTGPSCFPLLAGAGAELDRKMAQGRLATKVANWLTSAKGGAYDTADDDAERRESSARLSSLIDSLAAAASGTATGAASPARDGAESDREARLRLRLKEFYKRYDPLRVADEAALRALAASDIPEDAAMEFVRFKYGLSSTASARRVFHAGSVGGGGAAGPSSSGSHGNNPLHSAPHTPALQNSPDAQLPNPLATSTPRHNHSYFAADADGHLAASVGPSSPPHAAAAHHARRFSHGGAGWSDEWEALLTPFVPHLAFQPSSWNSNASGSSSPKTRFREIDHGGALAMQCFVFGGRSALLMHQKLTVELDDGEEDESSVAEAVAEGDGSGDELGPVFNAERASAKLCENWANRLELLTFGELEEATGIDASNDAAIERHLTSRMLSQLIAPSRSMLRRRGVARSATASRSPSAGLIYRNLHDDNDESSGTSDTEDDAEHNGHLCHRCDRGLLLNRTCSSLSTSVGNRSLCSPIEVVV